MPEQMAYGLGGMFMQVVGGNLAHHTMTRLSPAVGGEGKEECAEGDTSEMKHFWTHMEKIHS